MRLGILAAAVAVALAPCAPALADATAVNATVFPLPSNLLFPARSNRLSLKCFNPATAGTVTITYASGFSFALVPGGSLWETARPPSGAITATGTAGQVLACEDLYQ